MSYVVEPGAAVDSEDPAAPDSTLHRSKSRAMFAAQNRRITFRWRIFAKYYIVDLVANALGPFGFIIGVPCWGKTGAINMKYAPGSCKDLIGMLVGQAIFWPLMYFPIVYGCLVALGGRPDSDFDPLSESLPIGLMLLLGPLGSAFKYAFMPQQRFQDMVLSEHLGVNEMWDGTADAMNKWCQSLDDDVLSRELEMALWRTGQGSDGRRRLVFIDDRENARDGITHDNFNSKTLEDVLRMTIQKNKTVWQFSSTTRLKIASIFLVFLPFGMIPSFFRLARGRPFFGGGVSGDGLEIAATVYALLSATMMC